MTRQRLRILDLYCNAGGAGVGYARAGFDPVGVDLYPQKNYPFTFYQADALTLPVEWIAEHFDAVHASPPCQGLTEMNNDKSRHLNLIPETVDLLNRTGLPWIVENVEGARAFMPNAVTLCGSMFGLGTTKPRAWLKRHRLFIANFPISAPDLCRHPEDAPCVGVYGGHARIRAAKHGGRKTADPWPQGHRAAMGEAMGMDWATTAEMSEAIPPAYTEWLGTQLRAEVERRAA